MNTSSSILRARSIARSFDSLSNLTNDSVKHIDGISLNGLTVRGKLSLWRSLPGRWASRSTTSQMRPRLSGGRVISIIAAKKSAMSSPESSDTSSWLTSCSPCTGNVPSTTRDDSSSSRNIWPSIRLGTGVDEGGHMIPSICVDAGDRVGPNIETLTSVWFHSCSGTVTSSLMG